MNAPALPYAPLHFGPAERPLFGWYHAPAGASRACGVVLCNPIGDDIIRAHRPLRHLAERLSAAGFAVLRFDFHGTGDSAGDERDPDLVRGWIGDVGRAVDELRARSGAAKIAVAGLRLGATLAMAAGAEREDLDSVILWSPYLGGAEYVNETTKLHKMHKMLEPQSFAIEPPGFQAGGDEALGFLLTPETVAALKQIDLRTVGRRPAPRALVIGAANVRAEDKLIDHLKELGVEADYRHLPGHKFLMMVPHRAAVPNEVLDAIVGWLEGHHPVAAAAPATPPAPPRRPADESERSLTFGSRHPLFGILSRPPESKLRAGRPAVVMLNAGCVHRIGPHRFYVGLARRLTALGFAVLRMDLSGIGDSPPAPGCPENERYPQSGVADAEDAMNAVEKATGTRKFILMGLSSGADIAFQAGFQDPRVAGAVMLNPRTFCVHDLEMVETYKRARYYQDSLFRASSWKKALRGEVDFRRAIGMVLPKARDLVQRRIEALMPQRKPTEPFARNDVPGCLRMMAERGVDLLLIASAGDPGVDYVDVQFGKEMQALRTLRGFRREDIQGTDHTFTSLFAQGMVSQAITDHFTRNFLA